MNRRHALQTLAGSAFAAGQTAAPRPNILFLMTDEHRHDCYGYVNPFLRTPNIDRLAAGSVVFTNAYSTSPSCVPARAAIYTGRYPSQCGAPTYITYLPRTETTFMSRLRKAGYHTAAIGKQHFGDSEIERGYDYEDLIDSPQNSYSRFLRDSKVEMKQLRRVHSRFVSTWTGEQKYHIDDYVGERAKRWLADECPKDKPWFLTVSFHGPHQPFDGLGLKHEQLYAGKQIPMPRTSRADLASKPPHFADQVKTSQGLTDDVIRDMRRSYYSKISLLDDKIGAILDVLRSRGEYDRTLIVLTADHGDYMGDFGLGLKAQYLSEALMRIPMLAKPPVAAFRGRRETAFVQNFDIAPTSLAMADVPVPGDMSARDLSTFWSASPKRRTHCFLDGHNLQGVRDERWKLVHYGDRPYGELYDLAADPEERKNLWDASQAASAKADLRSRLVDHLIAIRPRSDAKWNHGAPDI